MEKNNFKDINIPTFSETCGGENLYTLEKPSILQLNFGNLCNIACKHCHVKAGPKGENIISEDVKEAVLKALEKYPFKILDLTGGAPEMMPGIKDFLASARERVSEIIVRTNLCILEEEGYKDFPEFYRDNNIHLVASLPSIKESITNSQRGKQVFEKSIRALKRLNSLGYGKGDLVLDLVYNPNGAFLPASQESLEARYKKDLLEKYDIVFSNLLTITNNPIGRFGDFLVKSEMMEDYMNTLYSAFNKATVASIMCKNTISVAYDGSLYDCDFNQAIGLGVKGEIKTIFDLLERGTPARPISVDYHCYGCTAGAGSSCGGSLE